MAADAHKTDVPKTFEELVPEVYRDFATVFSEDASHSLPPRSIFDHAIDLKPDVEPANNCKVYPLNLAEQSALDSFLTNMTACGFIRPSKSPLASPFFFIKKKDGKL
jgi:hypothetical protein